MRRFVWQAKLGRVIDIRWGDAIRELPNIEAPIDFLFLDGKPWEYLDYLKAAEPRLSSGAVVVADNAGEGARGRPFVALEKKGFSVCVCACSVVCSGVEYIHSKITSSNGLS